MITPTVEQEEALKLFRTGESLRIDAFAGSGKTTTLKYLAENSTKPGHYLAFNRSTAAEARTKFPRSVNCTTNHALAYRRIRTACHFSEWKMTTSANGNMIAEVLSIPEFVEFSSSKKIVLPNRFFGSLLRDACRRFLHSNDPAPAASHFPRYGKLEELTAKEYHQFCEEALPRLNELWNTMLSPSSRIPLGHDGYLKLWSLSSPKMAVDYIMLDEAQDSNPVILGVLKNQSCQVIYVGDPYQQIYEWRGAVNAMETVSTTHRTTLSQSFRFGAAIANAASQVVARLGCKTVIRGNPLCESALCPVHPKAILCRTNAGVISHLMSNLGAGYRCYILGGTSELQRLLEEVRKLKRGYPSDLPEFFGFANWNEVVAFSNLPEGEHLRTFVKLVAEYGEERILAALRQCEQTEVTADIILSTAHKAKGLEWDAVLLDRDFDAAFTKMLQPQLSGQTEFSTRQWESEIRLLYVAMTRARRAVELPPCVMQFFGLQNTRVETFGVARRMAAAAGRQSRFPAGNYKKPESVLPLETLTSTLKEKRDGGFWGFIKDLFR